MAKVRITWNSKRDGRISLLLEQLRYAGIVGRIETPDLEDTHGIIKFDLWPPSGVREKVWAEQNVARMRSFSIKAEAID